MFLGFCFGEIYNYIVIYIIIIHETCNVPHYLSGIKTCLVKSGVRHETSSQVARNSKTYLLSPICVFHCQAGILTKKSNLGLLNRLELFFSRIENDTLIRRNILPQHELSVCTHTDKPYLQVLGSVTNRSVFFSLHSLH